MHSFDALATLDAINEAFFAVDVDWRFTYVNTAAERQWSRSADSLLGKVMWTEFPSLVGSEFETIYREAARTRESAVAVARSASTDRWYEVRVFPNDGGIAAFYRDATDQKNVELALSRVSFESERERRMYRTALSNSPDMIYLLDVEGRFMFANEPLLQLWRRSMDEVYGRTLLEFGRASTLANTFTDQVQAVVRNGKPVRYETPERTGFDGRTFEYILMPVFDAEGRVEAVAGASRDMTERREAELAVRTEARKKDEFIATLAHELRNPLAPIRNALEVARLAKGNDVAVEYAHGVMDRQMNHMVHLIDDLLDMSRLNLGKVELRRHVLDVRSAVTEAIESARPHITQAGLEFNISVTDDELCVNADATRLVQIIANLLTNSAKFTDRGGSITLSASHEGDDVVIRVQDTGIGMSPELLATVFDMFTQEADPISRTEGGLGIGLTLVRGLVQLHGGTVEAHSAGKGLGSEFVVRLPFAKAPEDDAANAARKPSGSSGTWFRILVVDDNADSATTLSMMLNFMGHDTRTANSGLRGLELAEAFRPDVCLLDIGMPDLNGYELAERLREKSWGADMLLIALSGWGQDHDKERSRAAGFDVHLVKPLNPDALTATLRARQKYPAP